MKNEGNLLKTIFIDEFEVPDYLIKFSANRKHLDALQQGHFYMKEVAYYHRQDNNYAGDPWEGKLLISTKGLTLRSSNGDTFSLEKNADFITRDNFSFVNKMPMFCCSQISKKILRRLSKNTYTFTDKYLKQMLQFGNHFILIPKLELATQLNRYLKAHNLCSVMKSVEYIDKNQFEKGNMVLDSIKNPFAYLFKKYIDYQIQNEFRIIIYNPKFEPLINESQDNYKFQIEPLRNTAVFSIKSSEKWIFEIGDEIPI